MLLFIGGAPRTGKSILSRRLLAELHIPYLSIDVLKTGLANGVPAFGLDPDAGSIIVAAKLWPLVRAMCVNMIETDLSCIIEGEVLPSDVYTLQREYPGQIGACFLGYSETTPEEKVRSIRANSGHPNDWTSYTSDARLLELMAEMITFSAYLKSECSAYAMRYFDTSHDFMRALEQVVAFARSVVSSQ